MLTAPSSNVGGEPAGLDPCSILTTEEVSQPGIVKGSTREEVGTGDIFPTMGVAIRENGGLSRPPDKGSTLQRTTDGVRGYARAAAPSACTIAIEVAAISRVNVVESS